MLSLRSAPLILLTGSLHFVSAWGNGQGWFRLPFFNWGRDLDEISEWFAGGYLNNDTQHDGELLKRATSNTSESVWEIQEPMDYMAMPYDDCHGTASICPNGFACACQIPGSSRCLPTQIAHCTKCEPNNIYTGNSCITTMSTLMWSLQSPLPYAARPSGQCGGTEPIVGTPWKEEKQLCPTNQVCNCLNENYSRCYSYKQITATSCDALPDDCTDDGQQLPPPTAIASMSQQCGGSCWTGPTNCPTIWGKTASCWTQTEPQVTNGYAICDTARPADGYYGPSKLKARDAKAAQITPPPIMRF